MKEYTIIAMFFVLITVFVDREMGTDLLRMKSYYLFLAVIALFKLAVNGFLTFSSIVMYDPRFYLGVRIGSIPVEDFMFGFSMVTLTIVFWEYFKRER